MKKTKWVWMAVVFAAVALTACGGGSGGDAAQPSATALCNSAGVQPKIFNGTTCTNSTQSPVVQLIMLQGSSTYSCSGVMLTPTKVLSAAHCFPAGTSRVAGLVHDASGAAQLVEAQSWVNHPGYVESYSSIINDAAVVTLASAMPNPTMALLVSSPSRKGQQVFIAGWGLPTSDLTVGTAVLSKVTDWQLEVEFTGALSNTCSGDSGGPAYRFVGERQGVVGLTSTGTTRNCGAADQSLFTNIQTPEVLNFIRAQAPGAAEI